MRLIMILVTFVCGAAYGNSRFKEAPEVVEITTSNTTFITGYLDEAMLFTTFQTIVGSKVLAGGEKLNVVIISGGGSVPIGYKLSALVESLPNIRLICIECQSAASRLFVSSHHERLVLKDSYLMAHEMKWILPAALMTAKLFKESKFENDYFNAPYADLMGISLDEYGTLIRGKQLQFNGEKAIKSHLADRLIKLKCTDSAARIFTVTCSTK